MIAKNTGDDGVRCENLFIGPGQFVSGNSLKAKSRKIKAESESMPEAGHQRSITFSSVNFKS
jgi:hypothetical protein